MGNNYLINCIGLIIKDCVKKWPDTAEFLEEIIRQAKK